MNQYKKIAFQTLGCKLNFSETSAIARDFTQAGYARVDMEEMPDVLVINTCSVTDHADKKCRNIVSRAIRSNPGVFVAVVGCYAQLKPQEIASIEGVSLVLGAGEKFNLREHVENLERKNTAQIFTSEIKNVKEFIPSYSAGDRTRTFLKVQDGCNYFCSFCTIPLARGRSRSAGIDKTLHEAQKAAESGAREIVLTGVNIGDFGTPQGETFFDLIKELDAMKGVDRFRISSIEPNLLEDRIIEFVAQSKKFMPHFHIPLQSGSDDILRAMRRRYRTDLYRARINRIKEVLPSACIGIDVITGFPGETDGKFAETRDFLLSLPFSYLHVFTYSERPNTTALRINEVVSQDKRQERTAILRMMSDKKKRAFYQENIGSEHEVLWEASEQEGMMTGFTDNYIKLKRHFDATLVNQFSRETVQKDNWELS
ncbi:MAG: tRNA (N(6)-L-threonylcarbamoyladenosine(37)-C(2))-methylthiotransferase MtaB [Flavobacteriales bacterium]